MYIIMIDTSLAVRKALYMNLQSVVRISVAAPSHSFWSDDILQRLLVLFIMICLVIYGNNATSVEGDWLFCGPQTVSARGLRVAASASVVWPF